MEGCPKSSSLQDGAYQARDEFMYKMETNTIKMVSLKGSNYHVWKFKMENLLHWYILHRHVYEYIHKWVDDNVLNDVSGETHARILLSMVEELYAWKTRNNKLFFIKQMMSLKFFICCDYDICNLARDDSSWVVDSGATFHMTSQREFYTCHTCGDFEIVKMGNNGSSNIVSVGDICLKFDTRMELVLYNETYAKYQT
ncbi:hypothetical protein LXL04_002650 [Taraxacum kok-saghyz]